MTTSSTQLLSVRLEDIRLDGGTQSRAGIDQAVVERYAESVDELPPVDVFHDGESYWLADGFHRVAALELRARDLFAARVHQGTQRDAILFACGANALHGLPRTTADARRAVERLLADEEWRARSDRWIAETCRVSPSWVGRIRAEVGAHAEVREYERAGVPHRMDLAAKRERAAEGAAPLSPENSRNAGGDTFQPPEPDNVVRTTVVHEHQGQPLTDELRQAMRALAAAGTWTREALADRFRVTLGEVEEVLGARAVVFHLEAPCSNADPELVGDADDEATPSTPPPDERDITKDQWWTPPELAQVMVELAGVQPGDSVLEPSAGSGAIVEALLAAGASVEAHELDPRWARYLETRWTDLPAGTPIAKIYRPPLVYEGDYLQAEVAPVPKGERWAFKRAVINPPYRDGLDGLFLARALEEAEHVVALLRVNALCGQDRYRRVWEKHGGRCAKVLPLVIRPDFTGSDRGSEGNGAKSDFVVLVFDGVDRGEDAPLRHLAQRFGGGA